MSIEASNVVDLHRLKAVVVRLLDEAIAENGSGVFDLQDNAYWQIDFINRFDLSKEPLAAHVGSLIDDWKMTCWLADEPTKASAYSLTEVAPLLDYVGNKLAARAG